MDAQIAEDEKSRRLGRLHEVLERHQLAFNRRMVGRRIDALAERPGRKPGQLIGRTPYLQSIHFDGAERLIGRMVSVEVTAAHGISLAGRVAVIEEVAA
jgi:tRNA-2-methylthio-N6-dimethylallyladenosine synthase